MPWFKICLGMRSNWRNSVVCNGIVNISIFYDQDIREAIASNGVVYEELVKAMKELEENVNKQG